MGEATALKTALFLTLLMVLGGPLSTVLSQNQSTEDSQVLSETVVAPAIAGESGSFLLAGDGLATSSFTVDVPSDATITNIHLAMEPSTQATQTGFLWDDTATWSDRKSVV